MAESTSGFDINNLITNVGGLATSGVNAWASYNNAKAAASQADAAQQQAQASLNSANLASTLANNKTKLMIIGGVVAVLIAFIMFRR